MFLCFKEVVLVQFYFFGTAFNFIRVIFGIVLFSTDIASLGSMFNKGRQRFQ